MGREYVRRPPTMPPKRSSAVLLRLGALAVLTGALLAAALAPVQSASADASSSRSTADDRASIRRAFARAALDVGEAYFMTHRRFEPSLNGIEVDRVPDAAPSNRPPLNRLVSHATRRTLDAGDAMQSHFAALLRNAAGCRNDGPAAELWDCGGTYRFRLPSLDAARHGALELEAGARSAGTPISPFALLSAAFETAQWRPADVHPMLADSVRQAATQMRLRTRELDAPCHVTALWVLAAVVAEVPDIHLIGNMLWHRDDRSVDLNSLTRHAARRGCMAAEAAAEASGTQPDLLAFWEPETVLRISARAGGGSGGALGSLTAGELRADAPTPSTAWPFETGQASRAAHATATHRACDEVTTVQPYGATVRVGSISVHPCLAKELRSLLAAASEDGIVLGGWGWRSTAQTISLRQRYCPLPASGSGWYWTVLSLLPSGNCEPPVAMPTQSRHEYGLAVDFTCGTQRAAVNSRRSRCYRWLAANAHKYGLYNFTAEPWHWSIDGR